MLKVFKVKIKPIATYGIQLTAPHLTKANLLQLDIVKSKYLKKALALPMATNNDLVYNLCDTKRLCEELKESGIQFNEKAYDEYQEEVEEKKRLEAQRERNRLAFEDDTWKGVNQPRHFMVGYTAHGFHWCLCTDTSYHERSEDCICAECFESADQVDHLEKCSGLQGPLYERYKSIVARFAARDRH
mgnify:CR=1 FL=1